MKVDRLHEGDKVTVEIIDADGKVVSTYESTALGNLAQAVGAALDKSLPAVDPTTSVFRVTDQTTGSVERYRLNAHGNLHLIR